MIITVSNFAGGTAKTSTTIMSALILSQDFGKTVLIVDADSRASASEYFGITEEISESKNLFIACQKPRSKNIVKTEYDGIDILPGHIALTNFETHFHKKTGRLELLSNMLTKLDYDYILIDCMNYGGLLTQNALAAADTVIIPTTTASESLADAHNVIHNITEINKATGREIKHFVIPSQVPRNPFSYKHKYMKKNITSLPSQILEYIPTSDSFHRQKNEKKIQLSGTVYKAYLNIVKELVH